MHKQPITQEFQINFMNKVANLPADQKNILASVIDKF